MRFGCVPWLKPNHAKSYDFPTAWKSNPLSLKCQAWNESDTIHHGRWCILFGSLPHPPALQRRPPGPKETTNKLEPPEGSLKGLLKYSLILMWDLHSIPGLRVQNAGGWEHLRALGSPLFLPQRGGRRSLSTGMNVIKEAYKYIYE